MLFTGGPILVAICSDVSINCVNKGGSVPVKVLQNHTSMVRVDMQIKKPFQGFRAGSGIRIAYLDGTRGYAN